VRFDCAWLWIRGAPPLAWSSVDVPVEPSQQRLRGAAASNRSWCRVGGVDGGDLVPERLQANVQWRARRDSNPQPSDP
jgi:hypothetical protein